MANVYFIPAPEHADAHFSSAAARRLLELVTEEERLTLAQEIPLKVHFGEQGNRSFLPPETYDGVINSLTERGGKCFFIETSVLYGGKRFSREAHLKLAAEHGFTRIPVVIADGAHGEASVEVPVSLRHFKTCSLGAEFAKYEQIIVLSHFKGHMLAGFGGAIKQLSMGFASKGGKMAMHMGVKPRIRSWLCKKCKLCQTRCQVNAITIGKKSFIDHGKCLGCGACFSICPHHAVSILSWRGLWNALFGGKFFREKLVEYAYASHHGRKNLYITFAMNITKGCDCEPRPMKAICPDIGVFASTDPVAVDAACYDALARRNRAFRGREQLAYAEKIGLGSTHYTLKTVE